VKSYVRNTINLSWDKILLTGVITVSQLFKESICYTTEKWVNVVMQFGGQNVQHSDQCSSECYKFVSELYVKHY
jgi:hypothetical protein